MNWRSCRQNWSAPFDRAPHTKDALLDSPRETRDRYAFRAIEFSLRETPERPRWRKGAAPRQYGDTRTSARRARVRNFWHLRSHTAPQHLFQALRSPPTPVHHRADKRRRLYSVLRVDELSNRRAWAPLWRGIKTAPRTGIEKIWTKALTDLTSCFNTMEAPRLTAFGCFRDHTNGASSTS